MHYQIMDPVDPDPQLYFAGNSQESIAKQNIGPNHLKLDDFLKHNTKINVYLTLAQIR